MAKKYKLDVARDVDPDGDYGFVLNLDWGWRFSNEVVHTRGYDTMAEVRKAARQDVIPCDCDSCKAQK
ncbi:hypothetical protein UFOVP773_25 [uncultured Caudovirales phage]|uniref:Uncharacterized protein n=1 Tax=uncultured Caudovirales phage TaxID=2100421 RepID=A0A6J5NQ47_9CAUD|nr:hypothetical protein UFOVP773_25 [uncultured Caudovirales phage]